MGICCRNNVCEFIWYWLMYDFYIFLLPLDCFCLKLVQHSLEILVSVLPANLYFFPNTNITLGTKVFVEQPFLNVCELIYHWLMHDFQFFFLTVGLFSPYWSNIAWKIHNYTGLQIQNFYPCLACIFVLRFCKYFDTHFINTWYGNMLQEQCL